ncbi:chondroadherin-like protein [Tetranychus urticae]|uniref:chondroadherin-like protein n=1 Tax=Tetranychus urticae TaxID=32264 RepID=UPI00077BA2B0|nr:chondroadherin-like protein [Tetranychus urticae]
MSVKSIDSGVGYCSAASRSNTPSPTTINEDSTAPIAIEIKGDKRFNGLTIKDEGIYMDETIVVILLYTTQFSSECTCDGPSSYPIVTCASKSANLDLPIGNIVKALDYPSLGRLSLLNVSIDLSQPLTSKPIQHLRLVKVAWPSSLEPFSVNSLRYSLRRLEIISSGLTSFPFSFISSNYYLLKDIDLRYNSFQSIPDFAFSFNSALETIDLSHNDISYLGSYAFAQLPNLRQLILSHNKLKVVNNYALAANHNVNRNNLLIDLTYNKMFHLATGTFDNQTPTYLDLRHNSLVSLDQTVFLDLIKRMSMQPEGQINVTDNSFQCTCKRTRWLVELRKEEKTVIQGFTCKFTAGNDKDLLSLTLNDINC